MQNEFGFDMAFLDELASAAPTPGGGGAAAACAAVAASLASMVANLTIGREKYADLEEEVRAMLDGLGQCRERLIELISEDSKAFETLFGAYRMPSDTEEARLHREEAYQGALVGAIEVPLEIMELCAQVQRCARRLIEAGNQSAVSDAKGADVLAAAALKCASYMAQINIDALADREASRTYRDRVSGLLS